jgi:hypothetical protein
LSYLLRVTRVSSLEHNLDAPEHGARRLGILYNAIVHESVYLEVSFDTSDGV